MSEFLKNFKAGVKFLEFISSQLLPFWPQVILPSNPPWYGLMDSEEADLKDISLTILHLYARPKVRKGKLKFTKLKTLFQLKWLKTTKSEVILVQSSEDLSTEIFTVYTFMNSTTSHLGGFTHNFTGVSFVVEKFISIWEMIIVFISSMIMVHEMNIYSSPSFV